MVYWKLSHIKSSIIYIIYQNNMSIVCTPYTCIPHNITMHTYLNLTNIILASVYSSLACPVIAHAPVYTCTCICMLSYSTVHLTARTGTVPWFTTMTDWPTTRPVERLSLYKHCRTYSLRYRQLWPRPLYSWSGRSKKFTTQWTLDI